MRLDQRQQRLPRHNLLHLGQEYLAPSALASALLFGVAKLKLVLNVNAANEADRAYEHFFQIISALANAAIPAALHDRKLLEIRAGDAPLLVNGYAIALRRIEWPSGIQGGHELAFIIEVADGPTSATNAASPAHT